MLKALQKIKYQGNYGWIFTILFVAGDLMLFELIIVRVHCIVCIVCDWRSHNYLVVRIQCAWCVGSMYWALNVCLCVRCIYSVLYV